MGWIQKISSVQRSGPSMNSRVFTPMEVPRKGRRGSDFCQSPGPLPMLVCRVPQSSGADCKGVQEAVPPSLFIRMLLLQPTFVEKHSVTWALMRCPGLAEAQGERKRSVRWMTCKKGSVICGVLWHQWGETFLHHQCLPVTSAFLSASCMCEVVVGWGGRRGARARDQSASARQRRWGESFQGSLNL